MKKHLLNLFILVLILSACASQASPITGSWRLTAYGSPDAPTPAVTEVDATLTFDVDGKISGNDGCNSMSGQYEVSGDQITFSQVTSTLMACEEPQMAQEQAVYAVFSDAATFKLDGSTLTIMRDNLVLVFASVPNE